MSKQARQLQARQLHERSGCNFACNYLHVIAGRNVRANIIFMSQTLLGKKLYC